VETETDDIWDLLSWKVTKAGFSGDVLVFTVLSTRVIIPVVDGLKVQVVFFVYPIVVCCFGGCKLIFQHLILAVNAFLMERGARNSCLKIMRVELVLS
jgi:hypothetical protein